MRAAEELSREFVIRELNLSLNDKTLHISNILQSCLQTKYGFGYEGGSAVNAIVKNDLMRAFQCADSLVSSHMKTILSGIQTITLEDIKTLSETYEKDLNS